MAGSLVSVGIGVVLSVLLAEAGGAFTAGGLVFRAYRGRQPSPPNL